ncbi:uncharacterized protein LOC115069272 [Nannospalax galili]|uniref:uncharacterized protein LOC115069272 n=1 Tax=Nannospalax galili TaxID=1026970 RepID=UPI00111C02FA|nr:uncharacterized protein LOC115069272 [Nannospalax galili]
MDNRGWAEFSGEVIFELKYQTLTDTMALVKTSVLIFAHHPPSVKWPRSPNFRDQDEQKEKPLGARPGEPQRSPAPFQGKEAGESGHSWAWRGWDWPGEGGEHAERGGARGRGASRRGKGGGEAVLRNEPRLRGGGSQAADGAAHAAHPPGSCEDRLPDSAACSRRPAMFSRSSRKRLSSRSLTGLGRIERGQPCNACGDQCPGFALHKWRSQGRAVKIIGIPPLLESSWRACDISSELCKNNKAEHFSGKMTHYV